MLEGDGTSLRVPVNFGAALGAAVLGFHKPICQDGGDLTMAGYDGLAQPAGLGFGARVHRDYPLGNAAAVHEAHSLSRQVENAVPGRQVEIVGLRNSGDVCIILVKALPALQVFWVK